MCTQNHRNASVSRWSSPACLFSVLIKTPEVLAPSSTNPIALCSLVLGPNGLIQRLSSRPPSLLFCLFPHVWRLASVNPLWWMDEAREETRKCEPLHHWGQQNKKREWTRDTRVRVCACVSVLGEWGSVALELHTKAATWTLPCIYVLTVRDAECAWTWIFVCVPTHVCVCVVRVHRLVSVCTWVQGRDRLNLYLWSVPKRD